MENELVKLLSDFDISFLLLEFLKIYIVFIS